MTLLPRNATATELAIEQTLAYGDRLAVADAALRTFKDTPHDALLPFLVWEFGVGELLPWLGEDARRAISEGLEWNRLRGTPAALKTLIGWVQDEPIAIEEEEAGTAHFAEFMIDSGRVLSDAEVARLVAAAKLAAPARSRLARIFHAYDIRRFKLDDSRLGDALLSDYSGTPWPGDGATRLSFGRWKRLTLDCSLRALAAGRTALHASRVRYTDRCLLDEMRVSQCEPVPNPKIEHGHSIEATQNSFVEGVAALRPERKFCRAQIVLSDGPALEDTNGCTPYAVFEALDAPRFALGHSRLSDRDGRGRWRAILERIDARHAAPILVPEATTARGHETTHRLIAEPWLDFRTSGLRLSHDRPAVGVGMLAQRNAVHRRDAAYVSQRWRGGWQAKPWGAMREFIETRHFTTWGHLFRLSGLKLSDTLPADLATE